MALGLRPGLEREGIAQRRRGFYRRGDEWPVLLFVPEWFQRARPRVCVFVGGHRGIVECGSCECVRGGPEGRWEGYSAGEMGRASCTPLSPALSGVGRDFRFATCGSKENVGGGLAVASRDVAFLFSFQMWPVVLVWGGGLKGARTFMGGADGASIGLSHSMTPCGIRVGWKVVGGRCWEMRSMF